MARHEFIVLTRAAPGRTDEFDRWYDEQHIPDCLCVEGVVAARRWRILCDPSSPAEPGGTETLHFDSLAIYTFETEDPAGLAARLGALAGTPLMQISPALDRDGTVRLLGVEAGNAEDRSKA